MARATYDASGVKVKGQSANLRNKFWKDIHGRKWWSTVHSKDESQSPACPPQPMEWSAPIIPDAKYLTPSQNPEEQNVLVIQYDQWHQDLTTGHEDWKKRADLYALGLAAGDEVLRQKLMIEPSFAMLQMLGAKPDDPRYVAACQAGDPWALGLSPIKPAWAMRIWPTLNPGTRAVSTVDLSFMDDEPEPEPEPAAAFPSPTLKAPIYSSRQPKEK